MPNVLIGVSGGIAVYKACDLTSKLVKLGWSVRIVMTESATRFVGPITFEALSMHPVMVDTFETGLGVDGVGAVEHINWAKWADVAVLAPATANTINKLAIGIADNALTTVWMALPAQVPSLICPAMNTAMWEQPVTQRNLKWLAELHRHQWVEPVSKRLACGDVGIGGLADVADIIAAIEEHVPSTGHEDK